MTTPVATLTDGALALSASTITWTAGSWLQARLVGRGWRAGLVRVGTLLIALGILVMIVYGAVKRRNDWRK